METDPQITFRGMDSSPELTAIIRDRIDRLERFFDRITSCRVTVEKPHQQGAKGHLYEVSVDIEVPGDVIVVTKKPGDMNAHEDVRVAIRDSFNAAQRQLEDYARKQEGLHVKSHPERQHGTVQRLFADQGYGFLSTPDGREVYFQRDSVIGDDWDRIETGADLHFSLMDGEKGPFAVNVSLRG